MNDSQFHELATLILTLNGRLAEAAQEIADMRVDLQTVAAHLATIAIVLGSHQ